jgi:fructose-bisphosphate aldolase/2-amino-3,7-dideoxy-D-threo-hept-6-ulosonate synthase
VSEIGKAMRMKGILGEDGRTLIVALDHGLGAPFVRGLEDPLKVIGEIARGGADAIITTLGMARIVYGKLPRRVGAILSIPTDPNSVRTAVRLGFHAVKNTFFGALKDERLGIIHSLALECELHGMPLLAEVVPADTRTGELTYDLSQVKAAVRFAAEFGADIVKTSYTGSPDTFREVVQACPIPIVILGGARMDDDESVLQNVEGAIDAGAAGVAFGRNIFQHRDPAAMTRAIAKIIHNNSDVEEALKELPWP